MDRVLSIQEITDRTGVASQWPEDNCDEWVIDGILDALFCTQHQPPIAAHIELQDIDWHPVHSAPVAYYGAARNAIAGVNFASMMP